VFISIASFLSNYFLNISLLATIGGVSIAVALIGGIIMTAAYAGSYQYRDEVKIHQEQLRKERQYLTKLRRQLKQYDEYIANQLPTPVQHAERLPLLIATYRTQANRYRQQFVIVQVIVIILSVAVTSLSGGWLDRYISLPWTIPVGSGLISLFSTFLLFFKPREKGTNLQETADAMDLEFKACGLGIEPYAGLDEEKALLLLAKRTEDLRKDQLQRQQQLEQSTQNEQKATEQHP
jgi:hypothetical protein